MTEMNTRDGIESPRNNALAFVWRQRNILAQASRNLKSQMSRWQSRVLWLTVFGAAFSAGSATAGEYISNGDEWIVRGLAAAAGVAGALALFAGSRLLSPETQRRFVQLRSLTEDLKSQCYLFVTSAPPYDREDAPAQLTAYSARAVSGLRMTLESLPKDAKVSSPPPTDLTIDQYIQQRIVDQAKGYYEKRAGESITKVNFWKRIALVVVGIAVVIGAVASAGILTRAIAPWIAFLNATTLAITSYLYAERFEYLAVSYRATQWQLEYLYTRWQILPDDKKTTEAARELIGNCENAISIENAAWMSEWTEKKPV
ncbi:MAG: DUF4231 domain-containing protein, partial [candidate division Zixibacteria bacterium]